MTTAVIGRIPAGLFSGPNTVTTGREWGWKSIETVGNLADGWHGPYRTKREAVTAAEDRAKQYAEEG